MVNTLTLFYINFFPLTEKMIINQRVKYTQG